MLMPCRYFSVDVFAPLLQRMLTLPFFAADAAAYDDAMLPPLLRAISPDYAAYFYAAADYAVTCGGAQHCRRHCFFAMPPSVCQDTGRLCCRFAVCLYFRRP